MEEYIQSKRSHAIDFQLRMCNLHFSQHIKSKVRDKGYQNLQERGKLNISLKEMREIFQATLETHTPQLTDEETLALKKAFLLSKSVPKQSNRAKWCEAAGYQPNLLTKKSNNGKLLKGDLVFYYNVENHLVMYILKEDYQLIGVDKKASVSEVGTNCNVEVDVSKLVTDKGLIFTVAQELYSVVGDQIEFEDVVSEVVITLRDKCDSSMNDDDLCIIMQSDTGSHKDLAVSPKKSNKSVGKRCAPPHKESDECEAILMSRLRTKNLTKKKKND